MSITYKYLFIVFSDLLTYELASCDHFAFRSFCERRTEAECNCRVGCQRRHCVYFQIHLFFPTAERSLRPHIRLYHTIVPCKCCGDDVERIDCWLSSDCCCCSCDIDPIPWLPSVVFSPSDDPPKLDGFMPPPELPPMHGTPNTGNGSSGGVT